MKNFFIWLEREMRLQKIKFVQIYFYVPIKSNAQLNKKKKANNQKKMQSSKVY